MAAAGKEQKKGLDSPRGSGWERAEEGLDFLTGNGWKVEERAPDFLREWLVSGKGQEDEWSSIEQCRVSQAQIPQITTTQKREKCNL